MNRKNRVLRKVVIDLSDRWTLEAENFKERMVQAGLICCGKGEYDLDESILVTDRQAEAFAWKKAGGVCIGCTLDECFFEGAELVTDSLGELDEMVLEETLCHGLGLPVTITQTERLILREITEEEIDPLYQISQQPGMEYLMRDQNGENCFEPERMLSYIENVYRFYGYGLWSVWTKAGELIGCCGLAEFERRANSECPTGLELQYMVVPEYQRQGYGIEMCTAALAYAFERTDWEEIWVRIHPDNQGSIRLALRLGFLPEDSGLEEMHLFILRREQWGTCGAV